MSELQFTLFTVTRMLDDGSQFVEPLLFPEINCLGVPGKRLRNSIEQRVKDLAEASPAALYRRRMPEAPKVDVITVELPPPREPLDKACRPGSWHLSFPYIRWHHGSEAQIAYVPTLGIETVATGKADLEMLLRREILFALMRESATRSLRELVRVARGEPLYLNETPLLLTLESPKKAAQRRARELETSESVLAQVGQNLGRNPLPPAYEVDKLVEQLAAALTGRRPLSVLLVGPSGVGKTALVGELARRRNELLSSRVHVWSTNGSQLVAGMTGFGKWQERCGKLVKEAAREGAIVHLGNLLELCEVGQHIGNSQGIASFLRPYLSRGELLAIAECTPEQLQVIERRDPQLLTVFRQIKVEEPTPEQGRCIFLNSALAAPGSSTSQRGEAARQSADGETISLDALETLDRLHRRYATYSAFPGRPLRFLQNLLRQRRQSESEAGAVSANDVTAAFSRETGLPRFLLDDSEHLDLEAAHRWFAERVVQQAEAVQLVVDLLATVKAGVTRQGRPVASLLFIGPTGVGKTEMAKSLAEYLYQSPRRMVRFDMSEYANAAALDRLIGGTYQTPGLLTSKVREQPFGVVLLDEFEKAHPQFFDLLLQILGEGRLTDAAGRVAYFNNAVVIMTSNLGAETYGKQAIGFQSDSDPVQAAREHFERQLKSFVRPELFNRIDRIVPFAPLSREAIEQIARREVDLVRARDGIHFRGVQLEIDDAALTQLADAGFDPRYGARPLKRAIERRLLAPLADQLNAYAGSAGLNAQVSLTDERLQVNVKARVDQTGRQIGMLSTGQGALEQTRRTTELRRKTQLLDNAQATLRMRSEAFRIEQLVRAMKKNKKKAQNREIYTMQGNHTVMQELLDNVDKLVSAAADLEARALVNLYDAGPADPAMAEECACLELELESLVEQLFWHGNTSAQHLSVLLFSEDATSLLQLATAYYQLCYHHRGSAQCHVLKPYQKHRRQDEPVSFHLREKAEEGKEAPIVIDAMKSPGQAPPHELPPDAVGLSLRLNFPHAAFYLEPERGLHVFHSKEKNSALCLVETTRQLTIKYAVPPGVARRGGIRKQYPRMRQYYWDETYAIDEESGDKIDWKPRYFAQALSSWIESNLRRATLKLLGTWN